MKELFIEMASYYGNSLCNAFKGKLIWDNNFFKFRKQNL